MGFVVASTNRRVVESLTNVPSRERAEGEQHTPTGTRHAVAEGADVSACGIPLRELYVFADIKWAPTLRTQTCSECIALVGD